LPPVSSPTPLSLPAYAGRDGLRRGLWLRRRPRAGRTRAHRRGARAGAMAAAGGHADARGGRLLAAGRARARLSGQAREPAVAAHCRAWKEAGAAHADRRDGNGGRAAGVMSREQERADPLARRLRRVARQVRGEPLGGRAGVRALPAGLARLRRRRRAEVPRTLQTGGGARGRACLTARQPTCSRLRWLGRRCACLFYHHTKKIVMHNLLTSKQAQRKKRNLPLARS
ncbi:hypothetical protein T492DRAFT_174077, partial [Pavlovales sp. CCMP2436]